VHDIRLKLSAYLPYRDTCSYVEGIEAVPGLKAFEFTVQSMPSIIDDAPDI
jgi:hypothetical protein